MSFKLNGGGDSDSNKDKESKENKENKEAKNIKENNINFAINKNKIIKAAKIVLIAIFIALGLFIFFNYLIFLFAPFIISWIIAFLIQPVVKFLNSKLRIHKKLATVLFLLILFAALGFIAFFVVDRIIYELRSFAANYSDKFNTAAISENINNFFIWLERTLNNIPFFSDQDIINDIKNMITNNITDMLSQFSSDIVSQIPSFITSLVVIIPQMLIYALILAVSTFYICLDYDTINKFISAQIPLKVRNIMLDIKSRFLEAIYKYLKAYAIIILITYCELTAGFLIIGVNYAFILAAIVALVDILPVLGTGTILIPWGIISLTQKDYFTGFALLILYAAITIIRHIIEPKIVGTSIGLYPVVTLMAIYVGFQVLGVAGIFLFPIAILIIKNLNDEGKIRIWKNIKDTKNTKDTDEKKTAK